MILIPLLITLTVSVLTFSSPKVPAKTSMELKNEAINKGK